VMIVMMVMYCLSIINVDKEKNYLNFVDTGLLPNTHYKYKVEAIKINPSDEEEIINSETYTAETKENAGTFHWCHGTWIIQ